MFLGTCVRGSSHRMALLELPQVGNSQKCLFGTIVFYFSPHKIIQNSLLTRSYVVTKTGLHCKLYFLNGIFSLPDPLNLSVWGFWHLFFTMKSCQGIIWMRSHTHWHSFECWWIPKHVRVKCKWEAMWEKPQIGVFGCRSWYERPRLLGVLAQTILSVGLNVSILVY